MTLGLSFYSYKMSEFSIATTLLSLVFIFIAVYGTRKTH
jgi:hypothetical protein